MRIPAALLALPLALAAAAAPVEPAPGAAKVSRIVLRAQGDAPFDETVARSYIGSQPGASYTLRPSPTELFPAMNPNES